MPTPIPFPTTKSYLARALRVFIPAISAIYTMITPQAKYLPLSTQVGGHPGFLTSEDESLLFKPAAPLELDFYKLLHAPNAGPGGFEGLKRYIPRFFGTLKLRKEGDDGVVVEGDGKEVRRSVSLWMREMAR